MISHFEAMRREARVLLVEDDALVRMIAADAIAAAGFRVLEAENSAVALRLLARGTVPDVLVTDVRMPGSIDGFALAHIVAMRWPETGILVCSGDAQPVPGDLPDGAEFIRKPYDLVAFGRLVAALAARANEAAESADI